MTNEKFIILPSGFNKFNCKYWYDKKMRCFIVDGRDYRYFNFAVPENFEVFQVGRNRYGEMVYGVSFDEYDIYKYGSYRDINVYFIYKDFYNILFKVDNVIYDDFCVEDYILLRDVFLDEFSGRYAVIYSGRKYYLNIDKQFSNGVAFINKIGYNKIYLEKSYPFTRLGNDMYKDYITENKKVYIYNGIDYV